MLLAERREVLAVGRGIAEQEVLRRLEGQAIEGGRALHPGGVGDVFAEGDVGDLPVLDGDPAQAGQVLARVESLLCRGDHERLHVVLERPFAAGVQRQCCPVACLEPQAIQISREQRFQLAGELDLIRGHGALAAPGVGIRSAR